MSHDFSKGKCEVCGEDYDKTSIFDEGNLCPDCEEEQEKDDYLEDEDEDEELDEDEDE